MVDIQVDIVKEVTGGEHPLMRLTLYNEMSRLARQWGFSYARRGIFDTTTSSRPDGDHFPNRDLRGFRFENESVGYYMNLQFNSTGSHLAQAEGPWKIEQNYRMVNELGGGRLVFSVVNAGNVREHVLGLSANADMMWNFEQFDADRFLRAFCAKYYGDELHEKIAKLYQDFFDSYWQQKKGDLPGFQRQYLFQDLRYTPARRKCC